MAKENKENKGNSSNKIIKIQLGIIIVLVLALIFLAIYAYLSGKDLESVNTTTSTEEVTSTSETETTNEEVSVTDSDGYKDVQTAMESDEQVLAVNQIKDIINTIRDGACIQVNVSDTESEIVYYSANNEYLNQYYDSESSDIDYVTLGLNDGSKYQIYRAISEDDENSIQVQISNYEEYNYLDLIDNLTSAVVNGDLQLYKYVRMTTDDEGNDVEITDEYDYEAYAINLNTDDQIKLLWSNKSEEFQDGMLDDMRDDIGTSSQLTMNFIVYQDENTNSSTLSTSLLVNYEGEDYSIWNFSGYIPLKEYGTWQLEDYWYSIESDVEAANKEAIDASENGEEYSAYSTDSENTLGSEVSNQIEIEEQKISTILENYFVANGYDLDSSSSTDETNDEIDSTTETYEGQLDIDSSAIATMEENEDGSITYYDASGNVITTIDGNSETTSTTEE